MRTPITQDELKLLGRLNAAISNQKWTAAITYANALGHEPIARLTYLRPHQARSSQELRHK